MVAMWGTVLKSDCVRRPQPSQRWPSVTDDLAPSLPPELPTPEGSSRAAFGCTLYRLPSARQDTAHSRVT